MAAQRLSEEDQVTAVDLLWTHLAESEINAMNNGDAVLKHWVTQTYDFLNRIGYTKNRPRWECET